MALLYQKLCNIVIVRHVTMRLNFTAIFMSDLILILSYDVAVIQRITSCHI